MRIVSGFDLEADQSVISDIEKKWRKIDRSRERLEKI